MFLLLGSYSGSLNTVVYLSALSSSCCCLHNAKTETWTISTQ